VIISLIILLGLGNMSWKYLGGLLLIGKVGLFVSSSSFSSSCSYSSASLRLLYTGFLTSWTTSSMSTSRQSRDLSCSQSECGNELTISPTIHRIDLGTASCISKFKSIHKVREEGEQGYGSVFEIPVLGYIKSLLNPGQKS